MDLVLIQETKLSKNEINNFSMKFNQWQMEAIESTGASGGLDIIWRNSMVAFTCLSKMENWMADRVRTLRFNLEFIIINVYGPIPTEKKKSMWQEIEQFLRMQEESHIIIGGDFNTILYALDKNWW